MKRSILESRATPDGRRFCELTSFNHYGSVVYQTTVYVTDNGIDYKEYYRSYPVGKKINAYTTFRKFCNTYLKQKIK